MSSDFCSRERYSSLTDAGSWVPEIAGNKLSGPIPAWLDRELPGVGMLVIVMPEETLAALAVVGATVDGRGIVGVEADGRAAALDGPALAVGRGEAMAAVGAGVVGVAGGLAKEVEGERAATLVGRNFLLERSTEPEDCHERL